MIIPDKVVSLSLPVCPARDCSEVGGESKQIRCFLFLAPRSRFRSAGGMTCAAQFEVPTDIGPFAGEDAVHHRVTDRAVAAGLVVADRAVPFGSQRFESALRGEVEVVSSETDGPAPEPLEGMPKQQELASGVEAAALPGFSVPRVADFHPVGGRDDVVITGGTDNRLAGQVPDGPRQPLPGFLPGERGGNVGRDRREFVRHQLRGVFAAVRQSGLAPDEVAAIVREEWAAGGATVGVGVAAPAVGVSIHAPRGGSDPIAVRGEGKDVEFQSTLPAWGATLRAHH